MHVRTANALGAVAAVAMFAYALYAQYGLGLEPCPLCIFQRVAVIFLGCIFFLAAVHPAGSRGRLVYALLLGLVALVGSGVAGRHVWLTMLPPDRVPACGPGLDFMLGALPLGEALAMVFTGSGECAKVSWRFLGLSMPAWVFLALFFLGIFGVLCNWWGRQPSKRARISP